MVEAREIKPGTWKHKATGGLYEVLGPGRDAEGFERTGQVASDNDEKIIYRQKHEGRYPREYLWFRPPQDFLDQFEPVQEN